MRFLLLTFLFLSLEAYAVEKRKVCFATINSSEEKQSFRKNLEGQNFEFIELTEFDDSQGEYKGDYWFRKACEAKVQCDVLVISGHFGGSFFGESGYELSTDILEKMSCEKRCEGILRRPKEVWLMGCNTLATKGGDRRTPEEYLQVLLDDLIPRDEAERIVQFRYGSMGASFKARMSRIFMGVPKIYGFDSIGPSGKTVKSYLDRYFKEVPDYNQHLLNLEGQEVVDLITMANSAVQNINNTVLAEVLAPTSFSQCSGLADAENSKEMDIKLNICKLLADDKSVNEKLELIEEMISGEDALLYVPTINSFFRGYQFSSALEIGNVSEKMLNRLGKNKNFEKLIDGVLSELDGAVTLRLDLLFIKKNFGMISKSEFKKSSQVAVRGALNSLTRENVDILFSLDEYIRDVPVTLDDLNPDDLRSGFGPLVFIGQTLKTDDQRITKKILDHFDEGLTAEYGEYKFDALLKLPGYEDQKIQIAEKYIKSKRKKLRAHAAKLLAQVGENSQRVRALKVLVDSGELEEQSYNLSQLYTQDRYRSEEAAWHIWSSLKGQGPDEFRNAMALNVFVSVAPDDSPLWGEFLKKYDESNVVNANVTMTILARNSSSPAVVDWAIDRLFKKNITAYESGIVSQATLTQRQASRLIEGLEQSKVQWGNDSYIRYALEKNKMLVPKDKRYLLEGEKMTWTCEIRGRWGYSCSNSN